MKAEIKIPVGWRRLKRGEIIIKGDRYLSHDLFWRNFNASIGGKIKGWPGIRKVKK